MALDTDIEEHRSAQVDVEAYMERIGYDGSRTPDRSTLEGLVARHVEAIAFENLNPFAGVPVRLDTGSLEAKLVRSRRGGYCYEHNLLLKHVLDALGYVTTGLAARVVWNHPADEPLPSRSHMLLRVDLEAAAHLVDVGFGGQTPTGPLRVEPAIEQLTPLEPFRLQPVGESYEMQSLIGDQWRGLYRFGLEEHLQSDYEVSSWYLSNHPESPFVTGLTAARAADGRRYALSGRRLTVHHLGGPSEPRELGSVGELRTALEETFLLDLATIPGVDAALARLF